jgi:pilus assembly protein Flp/PilA
MRNKLEQLKKKGQGLVEYALILVLIAIVVILILTFLGTKVNQTFSKIGSGLNPSIEDEIRTTTGCRAAGGCFILPRLLAARPPCWCPPRR